MIFVLANIMLNSSINQILSSHFYVSDEVDCFGKDCYALAFGVPAVLMIVAISKLIYA